MFKRFIKIILIFSSITCSACSPHPSAWCPSPVKASGEVKAWYKEHKPLPPYLKEYLKAIGDQQEAIEVNCR